MYNLMFLDIARKDMVEIAKYISGELKNPVAANKIAEELVEAIDSLCVFPYANPLHIPTIPISPLEHEYRKLLVKNYMVLYWVEEETKNVIISRVVYARRNYAAIL